MEFLKSKVQIGLVSCSLITISPNLQNFQRDRQEKIEIMTSTTLNSPNIREGISQAHSRIIINVKGATRTAPCKIQPQLRWRGVKELKRDSHLHSIMVKK